MQSGPSRKGRLRAWGQLDDAAGTPDRVLGCPTCSRCRGLFHRVESGERFGLGKKMEARARSWRAPCGTLGVSVSYCLMRNIPKPRGVNSSFSSVLLFFFFKKCLFIYFGRQREREQEGQRKRQRENLKQAPHCQHRARHGA